MCGWRNWNGAQKLGGTAALLAIGFGLGVSLSRVAPAGEPEAREALRDDAGERLPDVKKIIARFVEATGGAEAYRKIENVVMQGQLRMPQMGMQADMKLINVVNGDFRVEVMIPGVGDQVTGKSGDVVWEHSAMTGPRILAGAERDAMMRQQDFLWMLEPEGRYEVMETVAVETFEGERAYKVRLVTPEGVEETSWFSVESGLLIGSEATLPSDMGDIPTRTKISDYRERAGVRMSHRMEQTMLNMTNVMEFTDVRINTEIDDEDLAMPEPVRRLVERQRQRED
ncbi:MAG: hypothetical protein EA378_08475 [Phycisphaerales bacterium]|nr:MAG: hypothetical protein EA378_08475 [Phycisphaerales bacterium]